MQLTDHENAKTFLDRTRAFLCAFEGDNNILLSSAISLSKLAEATPRKGTWGPRAVGFYTIDDGGRIVAAALNVPDRSLLISESSCEAARFLGAALAGRGIRLSGVLGPEPAAQSFCGAFSPFLQAKMLQSTFRLDRQTRVPDVADSIAPGSMRVASHAEFPQLMRWTREFVAESSLEESETESADVLRQYIASRRLLIWADTLPKAMAGFGGLTPNGVRVSMVYTDPLVRGRGYAKSLVHALSRELLRDHRSCILFAETANQAATRLYRNLGYRTIGEFTEYRMREPLTNARSPQLSTIGSSVRTTG